MDHVRVGAWLVIGGFLLAATAPVYAQKPAGDEALMERLRQLEGQPAPDAAKPTRDGVTTEEELIGRLEAVQRDLQSEASTSEGRILGEDEVRSLVGEGLGVEILSIEAVESAGRPAYVVTAMNPPGNRNGAFAVETFLVDGATGGLLGRLPQTPRVAGSDPTGSLGQSDPDRSGLEIRRRTYR